MSAKIQVRRDTAAAWTAANPTLLRGEIGFEYDTKKVKIGDGSTAWASLPYALVSETMVQDLIDIHADRTDNPHSVTKAQVGLGNVSNLAPANLPISTATQAALDLKYDASNPSGYVNTAQASAAAPVQSVAGKTGTVTLVKGDVGLGNVDNTSDANKPVSTAIQSALDLKVNSAAIGVTVASLDGSGKVPVSQLPSAIMEYKGAWNASTNSPALTDGTGDIGDVYRVSVAGTWNSIQFFVGDFIIYSGAIWQRSPAADGVISVNGYQGEVTLTQSDVGLGSVDNTADAEKPISTAQQEALTQVLNSAMYFAIAL